MYVKKLILIGSGAYEEKYAIKLMETRLSRLNEEKRLKVQVLKEVLSNPGVKDKNTTFFQLGKLLSQADSFNPLPFVDEVVECQYDIHQSVWNEAKELRQSGILLEQGKKVQCPVVAIHGDYDPHLSEGIKRPRSQTVKDFRFILLKNCGHYPWIERQARDRFYEILKEELS
ncbi:alpha/beta hydrolase [candidate division WOR-3 bacterium]|nr:alpha/beta hydrolase [candidate division WOR-3 bacterium]